MRLILGFCLAALVQSACGSAGADSRVELVVSVASSLSDAFTEIESQFESMHRDVDVLINPGGSSTLRVQILEGAPVDVFASADQANMDELRRAGSLFGESQIFALNSMAIAVPLGNPGDVTAVADFVREDLLIGLCQEEVPCGELANEVLAAAGIDPAVDTREPDVRALLTKIAADELDAGITYVTDIGSGEGQVEGIEIPGNVNAYTEYPIAVVGDRHLSLAQAFVEFVLSSRGQAILQRGGFESP